MKQLSCLSSLVHSRPRYLNWKAIALFSALVVGIVAGLLAEPARLAFAQDTPINDLGTASGRMCVFFAPKGAPLPGGVIALGHVGWGFRDPSGFWFYGSLEDRSALPSIAPGGDTYIWNESGTEQQMYNTFAYKLVDPGTPAGVYHQAGDYTQYRCMNTQENDTEDALNVAQADVGAGYGLPGEGFIGSHVDNVDCLTEVQDVLTTYSNQDITFSHFNGVAATVFTPSEWFYSLQDYGFEQPADIPLYF